jgi:hypothetical protein
VYLFLYEILLSQYWRFAFGKRSKKRSFRHIVASRVPPATPPTKESEAGKIADLKAALKLYFGDCAFADKKQSKKETIKTFFIACVFMMK